MDHRHTWYLHFITSNRLTAVALAFKLIKIIAKMVYEMHVYLLYIVKQENNISHQITYGVLRDRENTK